MVLVPFHFAFCVEAERSLTSVLSLDFIKESGDAARQLATANEKHLVYEADSYLSTRF